MKKQLYRWHTIAALIACIPLFVVSVTGSLLVFKPELDRLLMPEFEVIHETAGQRLSLDTLRQTIASQWPNYELASWELFDDGVQADRLYLVKRGTSDWFKAHVNPYQGVTLSEPTPIKTYFMDWLLDLHYTFLLHEVGLLFAGFISIVLCFLGISGLLLYRNIYANFFTLRWHKRAQIWSIDLHKMVGVISSPVLLILGATGAYWNITGYLHELEEHADGAEHYVIQDTLWNQELSLAAMQQQSQLEIDGFTPTYLVFPFEPERPFTFWGYVNDKSSFTSDYSSTVRFDAQSGDVTNTYSSRDAKLQHAVVDSFRNLHFGTFAGLTSRILWCVLGLAPVLLAITGVSVWWGRKRKKAKAAKKRAKLNSD